MEKLKEIEDFYYNEEGFIVLTKQYHLNKGVCCGNGCKHCPYDYINVPGPRRMELQSKQKCDEFTNTKENNRR